MEASIPEQQEVNCTAETPDNRSRHLLIEPTNSKNRFTCNRCKAGFRTYYQFYWHKKRTTDCQKSLTPNSFNRKVCSRCKKTFLDAVIFWRHVVRCYWENRSPKLVETAETHVVQDYFALEEPAEIKTVTKPKYKPKRGPRIKKCGKCGIQFRSSTHYVQHIRRKNACRLPPYECAKCKKVFKKLYNLVSHEKRKNSCKWYLANGGALIPQESCTECPNCGRNFNSAVEYQEHLSTEEVCRTATNNKASTKSKITRAKSVRKSGFYQCKDCFKVFPHPYRLKYHQNRKTPCNPNVGSLSKDGESVPNKTKGTSKTIISPDLEYYTIPVNQPHLRVTNLKNDVHFLSENDITDQHDVDYLEEDSGTNLSEVTTSNIGHLLCEECNKSFTSTSAWYKHGRRYHYEESMRPVKCPDCNLSFHTKYLLLGHQRKAEHWGKENCICPFCKRQFGSFKMRNAHIKSTHKPNRSNKVKEFLLLRTCQLCSKDFMDPASKDLHMKMRHKDVPSIADCTSNENTSLEEKSGIQCMLCKMCYETKELFSAHIRKCPGKKYKRTSSSLLIRGKPDGGITPTIYVCEDCGMTFTTKHHFSGHQNRFCPMKNHKPASQPINAIKRGRGIISVENGMYTFVCSLCKMKFNSRFQYSLHARNYCPMKNKRAGLKLIFRSLALKEKEAESEKETVTLNGALNPTKQEQTLKRSWQPTLKVKQKFEDDFTRARQQAQVVEKPMNIALKVKQRAQTFQKPWKLALKAKKKAQFTKKYLLTCNYCNCQFSSVTDYRNHNCNVNSETTKPTAVSPSARESASKRSRRFLSKTVCEAAVITSSISNLMKKYPNSCPFCRRKYCNSYVRDRHMKLHTLERSFNCDYCHERYLRSEYLTRHLQTEHNELLKFECTKCGLRYPTKLICHHHISKMHKLPFKDSFIFERDVTAQPSSYGNSAEAFRFVEISKPVKKQSSRPNVVLPSNITRVGENAPGRGLFSCDLCQVGNFAKMSSLQRHLKSRLHKENARRRRSTVAKKKSPNDGGPDSRKIVCSLCHQFFTGIKAFVPHRLSHFNNKNVDPTEINEANPYACEICSKEFSHHQRVQAHLLWHLRAARTPGGPSNFSVPGGERHSVSDTSHINPAKEASAKKSIGGGSPTKVSKVYAVECQIEYKHSIDCSNCNEIFQDIQHYEEHTCIKPFNCSDCGQNFANLRGLSVHKALWCEDKDDLESTEATISYDCNRCNQKFLTAKQFKKHACSRCLKCPYCGLSCVTRRGLGVHKVRCKNRPLEETYTCHYCSLRFDSSDDVGWHEKSCQKVYNSENATYDTAEQKRFPCRFCNELFVSTEFLISHETECTLKSASEKVEDHHIQCLVCRQILTNSVLVESHSMFHPGDISLLCMTCNEIMNLVDASQHVGKQLVKLENALFEDKPSNDVVACSVKSETKDLYGWNSKSQSFNSDPNNLDAEVVPSQKLSNCYQCLHCHELYSDMNNLKIHLVVHKPFECQVCGKIECTTQGYRSHPCRLANGTYSNGLQCSINVEKDSHFETTYQQEKAISPDFPKADEALDNLRENFSQLLFLLVADADLMATLGWGKKLVDLVLNDVLVHLGQEPVKDETIFSETERLRKNILLFLQLCIKDDVLKSVGGYSKPIDVVVRDMLHVCTDGFQENMAIGSETSNV